MNVSGHPVSIVLRRTPRALMSLIVLNFGSSANGHNGIRNFIAALSTKDFFRLYLGIARSESNVLARLPNFERQFWAPDGPGLKLVWEQIQRIALQIEHGSPKH
jgi:PTH1 family peptidyl-tRNA hydrolase